MKSVDIVRRAIEFQTPPRLPFYQSGIAGVPSDVWEIREMDRAKAGWFFDTPGWDDWGCRWAVTDIKNMGQVVEHPLADESAIARYRPPDPRDPYYYERVTSLLEEAGDRYVTVTCHFNLIERFHMLRGFAAAMEDFYLEPKRVDQLLDMILENRLGHLEELRRRFGNAVHGVFFTDDWGTQRGAFISHAIFDRFFAPRYKVLFGAVHQNGWHAILHSCGKVNTLVPRLIEAGADVLNLQQPRAYGLVDFGEQFKGKVCFLTTVDIQATLPRDGEEEVREEAHLLVKHWSTPRGGLIIFNYGDPTALGISHRITDIMFEEFVKISHRWPEYHAGG